MLTRAKASYLIMNTPIAFIVYKRPDTTRRVFETIRKARPPRLYLIADGPKTPELRFKCREVRQIVEDGIDWDCDLKQVYSETNLGLAKRVQTGLDHVFSKENSAIILEDDTLPDHTFFCFCEELLTRFANNDQITHISGCNLHSENNANSYSLCSIINIWGWATWARAWRNFDLQMESWKSAPQDKILNKWCLTETEKLSSRSMFDLHCENDDPWAWSYQWIYACWKHDGLSVVPHKNLVSNIGIGPDASNTKCDKQVDLFPAQLESMLSPIIHPIIKRDKEFEFCYHKKGKPSISRRIKNFFKWLNTKYSTILNG